MAFSTRKDAILAKIETTEGVDAVPTGASNAILCTGINLVPMNMTPIDRALNRPYFGASEQIPGQVYQAVDFEVEIAGSGAAGTAPAWGPLLRACGFAETISAGVKVDYAPISASLPSLTIYVYKDGVLHKMLGCRGNVSFDLPNQGIGRMKFTFWGSFAAPTDATLASATYTAFQKPVLVNATNTTPFTLHSVSPVTASISFDMANRLVNRDLVNGTRSIMLTNREPSGSINFETVSVASKAWVSIAAAATTAAMSLKHGQTAGNIVQFDAPLVQVLNPQYGDQDFVSMMTMGLRLVPNAGNDELIISVK